MRPHRRTKTSNPFSMGAAILHTQTTKFSRPVGSYPPRTSACKCLICGAVMEVLVTPHCEKHGYGNKAEFIAAGHVRFFGEATS